MSTEPIGSERPPSRATPGAAGGLGWSTEVAVAVLVLGALLLLVLIRAGMSPVLTRLGD